MHITGKKIKSHYNTYIKPVNEYNHLLPSADEMHVNWKTMNEQNFRDGNGDENSNTYSSEIQIRKKYQ